MIHEHDSNVLQDFQTPLLKKQAHFTNRYREIDVQKFKITYSLNFVQYSQYNGFVIRKVFKANNSLQFRAPLAL